MLISNPFDQKPDDARKFANDHSGIKVGQFPKMRHITRKDTLGTYFNLMQLRYGKKSFGFHPRTYILPEDNTDLLKAMKAWYDKI